MATGKTYRYNVVGKGDWSGACNNTGAWSRDMYEKQSYKTVTLDGIGNGVLPTPYRYQTVTNQAIIAAISTPCTSGSKRSSVTRSGIIVNSSSLVNWGQAIDQDSLFTLTDSDAYSRLVEDLRGSLDISIDLLSIGQNVKMFQQIRAILAFTRRSFPPGGRRGLNSTQIAQHYLMYTYGIAPLVSTLWGAVDEAFRDDSWEQRTRFRGRASTTQSSAQVSKTLFSMGTLSYELEATITQTLSCRTQYIVYLKSGVRTRLEKISRWTTLNPALMAWEKLPYSFVADWFYDVSGLLRGAETQAIFSSSFEGGARTRTYVREKQFVPTGRVFRDGARQPQWKVSTLTSGFTRVVTSHREVHTSFPDVPIPRLRADMGSRQMLNAAALLRVIFSRW